MNQEMYELGVGRIKSTRLKGFEQVYVSENKEYAIIRISQLNKTKQGYSGTQDFKIFAFNTHKTCSSTVFLTVGSRFYFC